MCRSFHLLSMNLLFILLGAVSIGAFAQAPTTPRPPAEKEAKPEPDIAEIKTPEDTPAPVDPNTYKIGPEDVLGITVWRERELSGNVVVRSDGYITIPLLGDLQVNNLTPGEVQAKLRELYAKLVNSPIVTVVVQAVRSKKYYIQGNVGRSGVFPLVVPTTVLEALTMAGGPTEFANKKKIIIMRGDKRLYFNWNDVLKGKNLSQNIYVENGDFIIVK